MGKWHDRCVPDGELGVRALRREFGAGAFPAAWACARFPVPGTGTIARGQANAWWRTKHPLRARGENPVRRGACARRGARSPTRRTAHAAASARRVASAVAPAMPKSPTGLV